MHRFILLFEGGRASPPYEAAEMQTSAPPCAHSGLITIDRELDESHLPARHLTGVYGVCVWGRGVDGGRLGIVIHLCLLWEGVISFLKGCL